MPADDAADAGALERLSKAVPPKVREVCETIARAGHQAVIVGGCVRDVLIGRDPGDWDVASSALPDDVMKLFKRTIGTGLQHGTVTVVMGKNDYDKVEVTTFRGEGAYSDARRPDSVELGVPLERDLARRDLTVNAIAYDPAKNEIIDPFGGRADIEAKRLRAVGNAVERFTEDGLRVMRAVRFAAQLEFDLDPETEAGIGPALVSLAKVSRERVSVELRKMLDAREPSRGFVPAVRSGIMTSILPALAVDPALVDRTPRMVRLAALLVPLATSTMSIDRPLIKRVATILRDLKFSNVEIDLAAQLVGVAGAVLADCVWEPKTVRNLLADLDRDKRHPSIDLWTAMNPAANLVAIAQAVVDDPLSIGDLAIKGKDLLDTLQMKAGPAIGRILENLLNFVIEDPTRNTRETLLAKAQQLELEQGLEQSRD